LPLGCLASGGDYRDDAQLLPKLGDGADDRRLGDFPAQGLLQMSNGCVATFQLLVDVHCELRNLPRAGQLRAASPVAIAAKGINIGKNPASYHEVGLFAGLSKKVEPYHNSFIF